MIKTIIVNDAAAKRGKTSGIKGIYEAFSKKYSKITPPQPLIDGSLHASWDTKAIFTIETEKGLISIGLESQGDPYSRQLESITEFACAGCDIIIAASRTKGETVDNIYNVAEEYNYRIIWCRSYICYDESTHEALKLLYADNIIKMVDEIIHNRL